MTKLILLRHGESEWNRKNLFTGWVDIPLSEKGVKEAFEAGRQIAHLPVDFIYTSTLIRGIMTAMLVMVVHESKKVPIILHSGEGKLEEWSKCDSEAAKGLVPTIKASELNERMYGDLQGLNKDETKKKYGEEQVQIWRRSYETPPPNGESLKMTAARSIPYFEREIRPKLGAGQNVLVAAHGNSLRSIIMKLDRLSGDEVMQLELPTGLPVVYEFEKGRCQKIS
ncbi:MAG: 2,3-bisphosphoglycerate-dependent phosphoglycerate mutase [Chlamydiia bacterium]|nr:2,3-bisphosphoglycerate-dependent phosphoglycerate mutase [Chlamydiia bacterium]